MFVFQRLPAPRPHYTGYAPTTILPSPPLFCILSQNLFSLAYEYAQKHMFRVCDVAVLKFKINPQN